MFRRRWSWVLALAAACAAAPEATQQKDATEAWFAGTFAGVSTGTDLDGQPFEIGRGEVTLDPAGTFTLRFRWADEGAGASHWNVGGAWQQTATIIDEETGGPCACLDLHCSGGSGLPEHSLMRAFVTKDRLEVGAGPCLAFWLPRVP